MIYSWWPPGHFITSIARRRAVLDGGTQRLKRNYWIARAFLASQECETLGIMRMINTSGDKIMDHLESMGYKPSDAVNLIDQVLCLNRREAAGRLPEKWSPQDKEQFLDLTHGNKPLSPTYVLLYDDMIRMNLDISMTARWNFKNAEALAEEKSRTKKSLDLSYWFYPRKYTLELLRITEGVLKYKPEASVTDRQGSALYFDNGMKVDLKTLDSFVYVPREGIEGNPSAFFICRTAS